MTRTRSPWSLVPIVVTVLVTWLLVHRAVLELCLVLTDGLSQPVAGPLA